VLNKASKLRITMAALAFLCAACSAGQQKTSPPANRSAAKPAEGGATTDGITAAQRELAGKMVAAINAKDAAAYKELVAPGALACFRDKGQVYLNRWLAKQIEFPVAKDYKLGVIEMDFAPPKKAINFTYAVRPTHIMSMEYSAGGGTITLNRQIVLVNDAWYVVVGCPTAAQIARSEQYEKLDAAARAHASEVYSKLTESLKSQLAEMAAKGDQNGAAQLCAKSMNVDLRTARELVLMAIKEKSK